MKPKISHRIRGNNIEVRVEERVILKVEGDVVTVYPENCNFTKTKFSRVCTYYVSMVRHYGRITYKEGEYVYRDYRNKAFKFKENTVSI